MNELKERLSTLCIFRELLGDSVLSLLCSYMEHPANSVYAEFAGALYSANGGDLSLHIRELCENSDNVYVRMVGEGKKPPQYMHEALCEELSVLQSVSELTPQKLRSLLPYNGFLPSFANSKIKLCDEYLHRVSNISKYGYGIFSKNAMFMLGEDGQIIPVSNPDTVRLSDFIDYERERGVIVDNTKALLAGKPAANILLTGDAGTGKSSTVKAVGNEFFPEGLRIIEVHKEQLRAIPKLLCELKGSPLRFILFIDDLSFLRDDDNFNALKAVLEGSVSARSDNVVIYATSNRRHIIRERFSDREGDDVHRNDTMQELISLSERFGLHVSFYKPNKQTYLRIVRHLADKFSVPISAKELEARAEQFALERGGRSARIARQFVDKLRSE